VDRRREGYDSSSENKVVTMSRFTFGFLLGAGTGWVIGSGKAAEWKRMLEDRRAFGDDGVRSAASAHNPVSDTLNGVAPEHGIPSDVAAP